MLSKLLFPLTLAVIPVYALIEASGYTTESFDNSGGSAMFPSGVAWFILILTAIQVVRVIVRHSRRAQGELKDEAPVLFLSLFKGTPGIFMVSIITYAFLIPILGFMLASFLFLTGSGVFLMYKTIGQLNKKIMLFRSVIFIVFTVGLYQIFMRLISVYLPTGLFGF